MTTVFYSIIEEDALEITGVMTETFHPRTGEEINVVDCLGITVKDPLNAIPALCRTLIARGIPPWTIIEFVRVKDEAAEDSSGTNVQCFPPRPIEEWAWRHLSEKQDGIRIRKLSRPERVKAVLKILRGS